MSDIPRTAVNQAPGGGTDYPFLPGGDLAGGVLDFYLSYAAEYRLPLVLTVAGDVFTVTDADAVVVAAVDTGDAETTAWGDDRTVYGWVTSSTVVRAVVRDDTIGDGSGTLDPRTCNRLPARVTSLRVGLVSVTENVVFKAGYNIALSGVEPTDRLDGGRFVNQVNLDAVPGAGDGRLGGCDDVAAVVRKINGLVPDCGGGFRIELDPCFRGQLPLFVTGGPDEPRTAEYSEEGLTTAEAKAAIKLHSDCHPCCECDYYVRTYRGLKRVWNTWGTAATQAEEVRDTYEENRQRWLAARQCRLDTPARLVVTTDANGKTAVGGSYCNFTTCCLTEIELRFTLQRYASGVLSTWPGGTVSVGTLGDEAYAPVVTGQVVRFFLDYADPQAMSVGKMKFKLTDGEATDSLKVTMTVHVPQPPPNPQTGDPCELPAATVPADILAIWAGDGVSATPAALSVLTRTAAINP